MRPVQRPVLEEEFLQELRVEGGGIWGVGMKLEDGSREREASGDGGSDGGLGGGLDVGG